MWGQLLNLCHDGLRAVSREGGGSSGYGTAGGGGRCQGRLAPVHTHASMQTRRVASPVSNLIRDDVRHDLRVVQVAVVPLTPSPRLHHPSSPFLIPLPAPALLPRHLFRQIPHSLALAPIPSSPPSPLPLPLVQVVSM